MSIFNGKEHLLDNHRILYLTYIPTGQDYYIVDVVKVKQDNGDWKKGVCYEPVITNGDIYVRTLDQFPSDKWRLVKMTWEE